MYSRYSCFFLNFAHQPYLWSLNIMKKNFRWVFSITILKILICEVSLQIKYTAHIVLIYINKTHFKTWKVRINKLTHTITSVIHCQLSHDVIPKLCTSLYKDPSQGTWRVMVYVCFTNLYLTTKGIYLRSTSINVLSFIST